MAYMNQAKKAQIAAKLKSAKPAGWKYTLRVLDLSAIVMTITEAPVDIPSMVGIKHEGGIYLTRQMLEKVTDAPARKFLTDAFDALNLGNYDRSDSQTDYFDVGHYVTVNVGEYGRPFKVSDKR